MSVDEFLDFAEARDERWELQDGVAYALAPERVAHSRVKFAVVLALQTAIRRAGLPCEALVDSVAVRISATTAYQPDALVYCGPKAPGEAREIVHHHRRATPSPVVMRDGTFRLDPPGLELDCSDILPAA